VGSGKVQDIMAAVNATGECAVRYRGEKRRGEGGRGEVERRGEGGRGEERGGEIGTIKRRKRKEKKREA
jgi:hypothetical protein